MMNGKAAEVRRIQRQESALVLRGKQSPIYETVESREGYLQLIGRSIRSDVDGSPR